MEERYDDDRSTRLGEEEGRRGQKEVKSQDEKGGGGE
jgi:hypothetical protein